MPVFYHDVMYRENTEEKDAAFFKNLYDGHDWKWFAARLKTYGYGYLRKHWSGKKASAPNVGEKSTTNISMRFTYAGRGIFKPDTCQRTND